MKDRQEQFLGWLSKQVSPSKLSNYGLVLVELETFAKNKKIISGSIFDINDPAATDKIVKALAMDRFYRFMHKKDIRWITELAQYLHLYAKERAAAGRHASEPAADIPCPQHPSAADMVIAGKLGSMPSAEEAAKETTEESADEAAEHATEEPAAQTAEEATEAERIVDFTRPADYSFTKPISVAYFGDVHPESSWRKLYVKACQILLDDYPQVFDALRKGTLSDNYSCLIYDEDGSKKLLAPIEIDNGLYVEINRSTADLIRNIKKLLDACSVDYENLAITYKKRGTPSARPAMPRYPAAPAAPVSAGNDAASPAARPMPVPNNRPNDAAARAEKIVLQADLAGVAVEDLSLELRTTLVAARKTVAASPCLVQLGDKIVHQDAFVDWEDGAGQLEKILDKLLDRNDGYVSVAQLYDFAHAEMQMFLNDNDMDDARLVYDMARHLFEKVGYHGKHLVFQSNAHISRPNMAVATVEDLVRSYALAQGGIFAEEDLVQYLQNVGVKTSNLRGRIKLYTQPNYLLYDSGQLILSECMNIDAGWFADVQNALQRLFADMGDHVVMRDIQPWWFSLLPALPAGRPWTLLLLQNVLFHYSRQLGGAHTISAMASQSIDTIHAMLVSGDSEVQSFADAVIAFLMDDGVDKRNFEAEELRLRLVQRGMVTGNELIWNMPKALANDARFVWSADGQRVLVKV